MVDGWFLVRVVLRRRRLMAATLAASLLVGAALCVLLPRKYTSSFTVLSPDGPSGGLLDRFRNTLYNGGFRGWGIEALIDDDFREDVVTRRFTVSAGGTTRSISIAGRSGAGVRGDARRAGRANIRVSTDAMNGTVTVRVISRNRYLCERAAHYALGRLKRKTVEMRDALRAERADYYRGRTDEAREALSRAEERLVAWASANRDWADTSDPDAARELAAIRRQQEMRAAVYRELRTQAAMDDLETVTQVPLLEVLDQPAVPSIKSWPRRKAVAVGSGLAGIFLAALLALLAEGIGVVRESWRVTRDFAPTKVNPDAAT